MSGFEMNRRTFMAAAGVAAASALNARAQDSAPQYRLAVKYGMIQEGDTPTEKLELAKACGFDGVEPGVRDDVDPQALKAASEAVGLPIHGVVNGSVDDIPAAIDRALTYGATSVLLVAGRVDDGTAYADNYERTQATIRAAIPYAEEKRIWLLVENVWNNFLLSPLEMARYLDELESDWVGAYFDVGNVVRFGYPEHWIPVLGARIKKLDIKEYSRDKQNNEGLWKGFDVHIGDGSINWRRVRRELDAIGYRGWATAEVGGGGERRLRDIAERMRDVLRVG